MLNLQIFQWPQVELFGENYFSVRSLTFLFGHEKNLVNNKFSFHYVKTTQKCCHWPHTSVAMLSRFCHLSPNFRAEEDILSGKLHQTIKLKFKKWVQFSSVLFCLSLLGGLQFLCKENFRFSVLVFKVTMPNRNRNTNDVSNLGKGGKKMECTFTAKKFYWSGNQLRWKEFGCIWRTHIETPCFSEETMYRVE